jgi:hypothetical protein
LDSNRRRVVEKFFGDIGRTELFVFQLQIDSAHESEVFIAGELVVPSSADLMIPCKGRSTCVKLLIAAFVADVAPLVLALAGFVGCFVPAIR